MTAVINLNILNFFRQKEDNSTVNNVRYNTVSLEKHQDDGPAGERVIDVTPFSRVIEDDSDHESEGPSQHLINYKQRSFARHAPVMDTTYNRQGRARHYNYPKGMHVDLYA
jgi:hypothetical protein